MAEEKVTIGGAVRYAFSLLAGRWRGIWGALALNALACTVCEAGQIKTNYALAGGGFAAVVLTTVMLYGAMYRSALGDRHPRDPEFAPAALGLGWRRMEWRLLGAMLLAGVFTTFIMVLATLVLLALGAGILASRGISLNAAMTTAQLTKALGHEGLTVAEAGVALLICLGLFLGIRLSLSAPATADQGAVRVLRTWRLTRGRFWQIFAAVTIVSVPIALISGQIAAAVLLSGGGEAASASAEQILAASLITGIPAGFLTTPLSVAVLAYFYRAVSAAPPRSTPLA